VEITIGVQHQPREIILETDTPADEVIAAVEAALSSGTVLSLTDTKGRRVLVPGSSVSYVEVGEENQRRVGFGAR